MTISGFEIPLSGKSQTMQITLLNVVYKLALQWRGMAGWVMDIAKQDGTPMVQGIPLVTGVNLLEQYAYLGIGGALIVSTDGDPDALPTYDNLGTVSHLYFVVKS